MDNDELRELTVEELEAEEILVLPTREAMSLLRPNLGVPLEGAADALPDAATGPIDDDVAAPDDDGSG